MDQELKQMLKHLTSQVDGIVKTLAQHGEILTRHSEMLVQHGEMLAQHGEMLAQHGEEISEIKGDIREIKGRLVDAPTARDFGRLEGRVQEISTRQPVTLAYQTPTDRQRA
ncbi:hypothetical protein CCP2SC5_430025 [Azospirillaceae bacterium]